MIQTSLSHPSCSLAFPLMLWLPVGGEPGVHTSVLVLRANCGSEQALRTPAPLALTEKLFRLPSQPPPGVEHRLWGSHHSTDCLTWVWALVSTSHLFPHACHMSEIPQVLSTESHMPFLQGIPWGFKPKELAFIESAFLTSCAHFSDTALLWASS